MVRVWYKLFLKITNVKYGKKLILKGIPVIYNHHGSKITLGSNCVIKSSFLSNLVGLYSRTIILTRVPGAIIEIGDNVGISGAIKTTFMLLKILTFFLHCSLLQQ